MRTRIVWIAAIVLLLGVLGYIGYKRVINPSADAFDAIPDDTRLIFEFKDPGDDFHLFKDSSWSSVTSRGFITRLVSDIELLDSCFGSLKRTNAFLESAEVLASLHTTGASDFDYLWVLGDASSGKATPQQLADQLDGALRNHKFRKVRILEKALADGSDLALAKTRGVLLISRSSYLVERAIIQIKDEPSIQKDATLAALQKRTAKSKDPRVYLQLEHLPELLSSDYDVSLGADNPLSSFAAWFAADFHLLDSKLFLSGYATTKQTSWLDNLSGPGHSIDFARAMPASTAMYCALSSSHVGDLDRFKSEELQETFSEHFLSWTGNGIAFVLNEPLTADVSNYSFLIVHSDDTTLSQRSLTQFAAELAGVEFAEPMDARHGIYRLENFSQLDALFGLPTRAFTDPHVAHFDDFVIFGNSAPALGIYLDRLKADQTLSKDLGFLSFRENLASQTNLDWYFRPGFAKNMLTSLAKDESNTGQLLGLEPIGLQLTHYDNHLFLLHAAIDVTGDAGSAPSSGTLEAVWRLKLDTLSRLRPAVIQNHRTNQKNILVQDIDNVLYLISHSGELLWSREMNNRIVGEVHQVDYFRNGKLQLMFTTERAIQLIDILGRDVDEFPLRLPAPSTSGLSIANYEDQQTPRMFVACGNGNVYGYKLTGQPLPGWNPKRNVGLIPYPIEHFAAESKDYIHFTKADGTHMLLNRLGENRRAPVPGAAMRQGFARVMEDDKFSFLNITENGRLLRIDASGRTIADSLDIGDDVSAVLIDIDEDGYMEMAAGDTNAVFFLNSDGSERTRVSISGWKELYGFGETCTSCVGIYVPQQREIYVLTGEEFDSRFPIEASSPPQVGALLDEDQQVLIVCTADGWVTAYRM